MTFSLSIPPICLSFAFFFVLFSFFFSITVKSRKSYCKPVPLPPFLKQHTPGKQQARCTQPVARVMLTVKQKLGEKSGGWAWALLHLHRGEAQRTGCPGPHPEVLHGCRSLSRSSRRGKLGLPGRAPRTLQYVALEWAVVKLILCWQDIHIKLWLRLILCLHDRWKPVRGKPFPSWRWQALMGCNVCCARTHPMPTGCLQLGLVNWVHNESDLVLSEVNSRSGTNMSCFFSCFNLHWYFASFKGGSLLQMTLDQRVSHLCWSSCIHKQAHISSLSALGSSLHKDLFVG